MISWLNYLRNQGVAVKAAILASAVLLVLVPVMPVAFHLGGVAALSAGGLASGLCLIGATIALVLNHLLRGQRLALPALCTAMMARMGIPLVLASVIHLQGGPLAEAGLLYYLLVFYPVTLAVETALSLPVEEVGTVSLPQLKSHPTPQPLASSRSKSF